MEFKDSQTFKNLEVAYAAESQARSKYDYFAQRARADGYQQIADIFERTASNEKAHAKLWFDALEGVNATGDNLKNAAEGEHYEWSVMYRQFAQKAQEEGFFKVASLFEQVADIENYHEARYNTLLGQIETGTVFVSDQSAKWICRNCGHVEDGMSAPEVCPVCAHPRAYYEKQAQ